MFTPSVRSAYKLTLPSHPSQLNSTKFQTLKRYLSMSNSLLKNNKETVSIGGVIKDLVENKNKEFIPTKYGELPE